MAAINQDERDHTLASGSRSAPVVMFEKPILPQSGSSLLALPSEIRTPILMHLVASTEAVPVAHQSDDEPQQVHLAILQVCQQLYNEAFGLFMAHNVPRVLITINPKDTWVMDWHSGRDGPCEAIAYNEFLRDTIPKFSRLYFDFSESEELASGTRKIRHLNVRRGISDAVQWIEKCDLREKEVTLAYDPSSIQLYDKSKGQHYWPLLCIGRIRCKKLHLLGFENDIHTTNLVRVIEGRLSVENLKAACEETTQHLKNCMYANGRGEDFIGEDYHLWSPLWHAAKMYDVAKCEEIRARLVARCELEFQDFVRTHEGFKRDAARPWAID